MTHRQTEALDADRAGVARAARLLSSGALVAFPTETVYGLGADATDDRAVAAVFEAKGRPRFNPLIAHLPDLDRARDLVEFPDDALRLAQAFWPGPLTLVLPLRRGAAVSPLVTSGLDTLAVRVPDLPLARDLLARVGRPVAAPSANPSGRTSPTRAEHVLAGLGGRITAVLDGGPCAVGLESTIVGMAGAPRLLRPGGIPVEAVEACLGIDLAPPPAPSDAPDAPGQLASHYAPDAALRLNASHAEPDEAYLGFGAAGDAWSLSPTGDLTEAAARLFHILREIDAAGLRKVAVAPIPERGLGRAINDRLRRAAAPR